MFFAWSCCFCSLCCCSLMYYSSEGLESSRSAFGHDRRFDSLPHQSGCQFPNWLWYRTRSMVGVTYGRRPLGMKTQQNGGGISFLQSAAPLQLAAGRIACHLSLSKSDESTRGSHPKFPSASSLYRFAALILSLDSPFSFPFHSLALFLLLPLRQARASSSSSSAAK